MKHWKTSELLQNLFNASDRDELVKETSWFTDRTDTSLDGFHHGIELHILLMEVRKIKGNENAEIYQITYDCGPGMDDSILFFVGTQVGLQAMFLANPAQQILSDSDRQDLGDNGDET